MLNKRGSAMLTSPFNSFLLCSFVYLRLISHLFIYLLFIGSPFHSGPMYVNCVMPFNSNIGLKRALNEKSIHNTDHFAIQLKQMDNCYFFIIIISPLNENPSLTKGT